MDNGLIRKNRLIWIGNNSALQTRLISNFHSSVIGGHSGVNATYHRLKQWFVCKGMKIDIENYIKQCQVCQHTKHSHQHPSGLLQPLPIREGVWAALSMDFIEGLPRSEGYSVILVVVDRFIKFAHFLLVKHPYTAL